MSHEQLLRSRVATPVVGASPHQHEDESLAPPHPYPGWQPTGAGDPNALLAWIDHDLKGHDAVLDAPPRPLRGEPEQEGFAKPVKTGIKWAERVEQASAIAEKVKLFENPAVRAASRGVSAALSPLGIAGGMMEMMEGTGECRDGNCGDGAVHFLSGLLGVGSGAGGLAGLARSGLGDASLVLDSGAAGMKIGNYGDHQVKRAGWLHGENGAESASEWAGSRARSVQEHFAERGHPIVGDILGAGALVGTIFAGTGIALAGAGNSMGSDLAHHHRVNRFLGYEGMNLSRETAEGLADYDDEQRAAAERFEREHPERFGHNPNNPSQAEAFAQLTRLAQARGGTR